MAILPFLAGAALSAAPLPAVPATPQPAVVHRVPDHPGLWVINDRDTVIYLFGTFHALDTRSNWFRQAVKTAFTASDQLILETLIPDSLRTPVAAVPAPIPNFGARRGPLVKLAPSASSMLASSRTVMTAGRAGGMSTDRGADAVLRDAAEQSGKRVGGLESFQFQISMFNKLQDAPKASAPDPAAMRALAQVLGQLEGAWNRGDIDAFAPLLMQMRAQSPETYKTMFVERNARWAHWIADRLKQPGTVFVAVGAGHLSGPDSVQIQLRAIGVDSARIN
jgi:uncharacterized protein YbaP (TraB family)